MFYDNNTSHTKQRRYEITKDGIGTQVAHKEHAHDYMHIIE